RVRPHAAQDAACGHRQEGCQHSRHNPAESARRPLSGRIVGRPAAARCARPRADRRARDPAARRAAVEPRRQSARGDALRGAPAARRIPLHHRLRDARPVRGDDHRRPDRRDEPRQDRAAGEPRGHLRPAALRVRRALHRRRQHPQGQGARRRPCLGRRRAAALRRRRAHARQRHRDLDPPARDATHDSAARGGQRQYAAGHRYAERLPRQQPRLYGRAGRRHAAARRHGAAREHRAGREGLAASAGRTLPGAARIRNRRKRAMRRNRFTRRDVLKGTAALAASTVSASPLVAAAPPPTAITPELIEAAKKEGKVIYYTSIDLPLAEKIAKSFEAKYPGVAVRVERSGAERIFQRIGQEYSANIHAVDVVNSSDAAHFIVWKRDGLLAPYVPEDIAQFYPSEHKDPDGMFASFRVWLSVIAYNSNLVKTEDARKSFADLLDAKWVGKIVKGHPGYSGTIMTATYQMARDLGWDYFEKLAKQRVMQVQSSADPPKKLALGERAVMAD